MTAGRLPRWLVSCRAACREGVRPGWCLFVPTMEEKEVVGSGAARSAMGAKRRLVSAVISGGHPIRRRRTNSASLASEEGRALIEMIRRIS